MRTPSITLLALIAAACSEAPEASNPPAAVRASEPPVGDRLASLPDPQRRAVLLRAIRDAGLDCQHVGSAERKGRYRGLPVWRATCRDGSAWTIVISEGETAQVLSATEDALAGEALSNGS